MQKKIVIHSIILLISVIAVFLWITNERLNYFSLQLSAILLIILIVTHRILKPATFHLAESTISTISVLLIVNATGNITSPLFFLNYFLLFEMSLLLEPLIPISLAFILLVFYLFTSDVTTTFRFMELISFPFMTPLAYFFGKIYQKEENQKKEIRNLSNKVEELEEELAKEELL